MFVRSLAAVCGILGGLCLVTRHFVDDIDALQWAGLGLLGLAAFCVGLTLAPKAPLWLKGIVGLGVVALVGSVLATVRSEADAAIVDLGLGIAAVVVFAVLAVRWSRSRASRTPRVHGTHSR